MPSKKSKAGGKKIKSVKPQDETLPSFRRRNWCWTFHNYTPEDEEKIQALDCKFVAYAKELGDKGDTPHLQGFITFDHKHSLRQCKLLFPGSPHFTACTGTAPENFAYLKKECGALFTKGAIPMSAAAKGRMEQDRWDGYKELMKENRLDELPSKIFCQNYRSAKQIAVDYMANAPNEETTTGLWLYGESGAGKTHLARNIDPDFYNKNLTKWWDGYQGQKTAVLDDLSPYHKGLGDLIKLWGDKWSTTAEVKTSSMNIRPKLFIITSQYLPEQIWDDSETIAAIRRRFIIKHISADEESRRKRPKRVDPLPNFPTL